MDSKNNVVENFENFENFKNVKNVKSNKNDITFNTILLTLIMFILIILFVNWLFEYCSCINKELFNFNDKSTLNSLSSK